MKVNLYSVLSRSSNHL